LAKKKGGGSQTKVKKRVGVPPKGKGEGGGRVLEPSGLPRGLKGKKLIMLLRMGKG